MAFKVNYNQQRAERDRAKQAKKDAKLREQEAELMRRRNSQRDDSAPEPDEPGTVAPEEGEPRGTA